MMLCRWWAHVGFRLRAGDWRAIFVIVEGRLEVTRVMHRREAYR
jgi:mRNA-degrading endonuclease RelE of RelBE toxin-antitoxin system